MINVAVLGYGTVGSGVVEVLRMNRDIIDKNSKNKIRVKYVLDLLDFPNDPIQEKIVHDFDVIVNDEDIHIVVEAMGGLEPAHTFVKQALMAKKHVCTSNKALVAAFGNELIACARENNVSFLFEASCGGGIPVIRPLNNALVADDLSGIIGILNGTTNYILTDMANNDASFEAALKDAQALGYAEADPTSDVEGEDSCRKIAILSSIVYERFVDYKEIMTEGITKLSKEDILYAKAMGRAIKLIAMSKKEENGAYAIVAPFMLKNKHPLYSVSDVFNAVLVHGNAANDVMFYGSGAGKLPTASAVVSDIVEIASNIDRHIPMKWNTEEKCELSDIDQIKFRHFVRLKGSYSDRQSEISEYFGKIKACIELDEYPDEFGIITGYLSENDYQKAVLNLEGVLSRIRLMLDNQ